MAKKITELNEATRLNNNDLLVVVQDGETKKINAEKIINKKVLYESTTGSNGNVSLNDNLSNYDYIEISFKTSNKNMAIQKFSTDMTNIVITGMEMEFSGNIHFYNYFADYKLDGNKLTYVTYGGKSDTVFNSSGSFVSGSCAVTSNQLYITKVVGYK